MEYISIFNSHDANFVKIRVCKISLITADFFFFNFRAVARFSNPEGWIITGMPKHIGTWGFVSIMLWQINPIPSRGRAD